MGPFGALSARSKTHAKTHAFGRKARKRLANAPGGRSGRDLWGLAGRQQARKGALRVWLVMACDAGQACVVAQLEQVCLRERGDECHSISFWTLLIRMPSSLEAT